MHEKLVIWFFRDLTDEQRQTLFKIYGAKQYIEQGFGSQTRALRYILDGNPLLPKPVTTEDQIKLMAERFLNWKLPEDFKPDGGITFERVANAGTAFAHKREPTGTNLLDYGQAVEMVRHMVDLVDQPPPPAEREAEE